MTFTVTYRDQRGAKCEAAIDAADRSACVAACRSHGISPIAIREGKGVKGKADRGDNGLKGVKGFKGAGSKGANGSKGVNGLLAALALLILLGGAAWWWFGVRGAPALPEDEPKKPKAMPKEVAPAKVRKIPPPPVSATAQVEVVQAPTPTVPTNRVRGNVVKAIPAGIVDRVVDEDGNVTYRRREPPFTNRVDALVLSAIRPGGFPMGLRQWAKRHTREELIAALKAPVNFNEDDTELLVASKRSVEDMKAQMLGLLEKGHSLDEVLGEIEPAVNTERTERGNAEKTLRRLMKEADPETVREYVRCANEELKAKGLKELYLPARFRDEGQAESAQASEQAKGQDERKNERSETE